MPKPAPMPAPLAPSMSAPAAAPTAVPTAALLAVASLAAWVGVVPPICMLANWRHSRSSARNWSKVLLLPGSDMMLGPLGAVAHAPSVRRAAIEPTRRQETVIFSPLDGYRPGAGAGTCFSQ